MKPSSPTADAASGLTTAEARARLAQFGPNRILRASPVRFLAIAREEVTEPMILLLLGVGVLYSLWGNLADAATIFAIIATLVFAEVYNEFRAKRAIAALERIAAPKAHVLRDGALVEVDAEAVVPGDLLVLAQGTRLAADARVTRSSGLACDESALSGESMPVDKAAGAPVYAGTVIVSGEGEAQVSATGVTTRIGGMAQALAQVARPKTPLQLAMRALAGKLVWVAVFFAVLIPLIGVLRGQDWREMVLTGLSLAFATIPEELPIIITMVLGLGAYTLSRSGFLVKRIHAAETLAEVTVIATDKTGTLTENRLRLAAVYPQDAAAAVLGTALGNVAAHLSDPLERALVEAGRAQGLAPPPAAALRTRLVGDGRKTRSTLREAAGALQLYLSGAPEEVFAHAASQPPPGAAEFVATQAAQGRRVIAVAHRTLATAAAQQTFDDLEHDLEIVGLVSFEDPPRPGVKDTIAQAAAAGIRTLMVTGDHPATAASIAGQVGIPAERVLTGADLERLDDPALARTLREVSVFARTSPEHKYRIVQALQGAGEVVAVTGDGINDALALKAADVGIAMGMRGTDVAREAAQVVLADDNFVTITHGVFEGRKFYDNLRKGVSYYLAVKFGLILIFLLPALAGLPLPFSPIQIIVLELFMDLAASAGFVAEPGEPESLARRPGRRGAAAILDRAAITAILFKGALLFAAVMAAYGLAWARSATAMEIQTCAFAAWMVAHVVLAFVSRSERATLRAIGPWRNRVINLWALSAIGFVLLAMYLPALHTRFRLEPLGAGALTATLLLAAGIASLAELAKYRKRWRATRPVL
nr:J430 [uncultured bacterium]